MKQKYFIVLALLVAIVLLASGCSTMHKVKNSKQSKSDSTEISSVKKSGTSSVDSSGLKQKETAFEKEIVLEFENEASAGDHQDPVEKANDLAGQPFPPKVKPAAVKKAAVHSVKVNGNMIESDRPIKSISVKENGQTKEIDLHQVAKRDSGQLEENRETTVKKEEKTKDKNVERSGISVGLVISIAVLLLLTGIGCPFWADR